MVEIIGKKIIKYQEIDSTNDEARRLIAKGKGEGTVAVAGTQTKGKGKPGSRWFSPAEAGIYLSAIIRPFRNPKDLGLITQLGARAAVRAIKRAAGLEAEIKLPNDVLINSKKVGGILVERTGSGHLIIGIGVNLNNAVDSFPPEIKAAATSLKIETGETYDLSAFTDLLIGELDKEYLAYLAKI
jgi:BirA family biotin operon repressor/biotin-[acetyl-CoA-carboxylase] ligase